MLIKILLAISLYVYKETWIVLEREVRDKYMECLNSGKDNLPEILFETLIIAEDKRFYKHKGFDVIAMIRATLKIVFYKKLEGASTITQQLVRTLLNDRDISLKRKVREICLSVLLESKYSKIIVLELYLNVAYFGWSMVGIHEACFRQNYNIHYLTLEQSALLIARLKYPEPRSLTENYKKRIMRRVDYLIDQLNKRKEKKFCDTTL